MVIGSRFGFTAKNLSVIGKRILLNENLLTEDR